MDKRTCGELYLEALKELDTEHERRIFAAGFVTGQAEKVYLGACPAAMFRPSDEVFDWLLSVVAKVCLRYDLKYIVLPAGVGIREIWISRHATDIGRWFTYAKDSPQWHRLRAEACGIPMHEVDVNFHDRKAYEQPCDQGALKT